MSTLLDTIEATVDGVLTQFKTSEIKVYPAVTSGTYDQYKQKTKAFGTGVAVAGRAIQNPTEEQVTAIGSGERYDAAFVFSRLELKRRFSSAAEGEWIDVTAEIGWNGRRFKLMKVRPTGQIENTFVLVVALGNTVQGDRD